MKTGILALVCLLVTGCASAGASSKPRCVTFDYAVEQSVNWVRDKGSEDGNWSDTYAQRSLAWSAIAANLRDLGSNGSQDYSKDCVK